eukprot:4912040-Pleurochrysis_carterae.AAC.15
MRDSRNCFDVCGIVRASLYGRVCESMRAVSACARTRVFAAILLHPIAFVVTSQRLLYVRACKQICQDRASSMQAQRSAYVIVRLVCVCTSRRADASARELMRMQMHAHAQSSCRRAHVAASG